MSSQKIVLITGGNSGVGYEAVKALLESDKASYHVLLGSRSPEKGKVAVESLHKECPNTPNTVEPLQVDLTSDDSIQTAFEKVKTSHGRIDVLVNNAGTSLFHDTIPIIDCRRIDSHPQERHMT